MNSDSILSMLRQANLPADWAPQLFRMAMHAESTEDFLAEALATTRRNFNSEFAAVVRGTRGQWRSLLRQDESTTLPYDLMSDALDQDQAVQADDWVATPLEPRSGKGELLVARWAEPASPHQVQQLVAVATLIDLGLEASRSVESRQRRITRLEAILGYATQWNQTLEMQPLLHQMAETATELLQSERASIFLWDRPNKSLVGRPALGVEGGELIIPDNTGIVGQVVQTGETRRVDMDNSAEQTQINRAVDKSLKFQTKSLLCVPLRGRNGHLFGAFEMINKIGGDFTDEDESALIELASHAAIALENTQQYEHLLSARKQLSQEAAQGVRLIGECPAIVALKSTIQRVADTDLAILVLGENGCGKEVVAQLAHYLSSRRDEPLVAVNCAAIAETLLESELFGHEKGAFTDAHETRIGKFELASGGTLFLDEIGDMSLAGQAKLLRVLEEKVIVRVGGSNSIYTDARVIAATNQNLAQLVEQKKFREDLYYRLNVVTLELPPLRERVDDVLMLADFFLVEFCSKARRKVPRLTSAAKKKLMSHNWPGNVRELRNLMERLAFLTQGDKVDADELAFILSPGGDRHHQISLDSSLADASKQFQIDFIQRHIEASGRNMTLAAERLGLHRSNLYRKMRQLGMTVDESNLPDRMIT